jgi:molybdate transport system ATP-binding protein
MNLSVSLNLKRPDFELHLKEKGIPLHGVTALMGRSGSGKSTLLRFIAGIEPESEGRLQWGDEVWHDGQHRKVPPQDRHLGMVFQDAALFPHLSVRGNLEFAQRFAPARLNLEEVARRCRIGHRLDFSSRRLSGGEKQRVAIARALLSAPRMLLLDEPLSSLDEATRSEVLEFLLELKRDLHLPMIYVTHSRTEASLLADRVFEIREGRWGDSEG